MEMCFNDIHICACVLVGKVKEQEIHIYLTFMLGISNDFLHPCDGPWNNHLFFNYFLVDFKFKTPNLQYTIIIFSLYIFLRDINGTQFGTCEWNSGAALTAQYTDEGKNDHG